MHRRQGQYACAPCRNSKFKDRISPAPETGIASALLPLQPTSSRKVRGCICLSIAWCIHRASTTMCRLLRPDAPNLTGSRYIKTKKIEVYKNKVQCATTYALAGTLRCSLTAEIAISGTHFVLICCRRMLAALQNRALGLGAASNLSVGQLEL